MKEEENGQSQEVTPYQVGDKTKAGVTINEIVNASNNHVVFLNKEKGLCWEVTDVDEVARFALQKARTLMDFLANSVSMKYANAATRMIGNSLSSALYTDSVKEAEKCFSEAEKYLDLKAKEIKRLVSHGKGFKVYLSASNSVHWVHKDLENYLTPAVSRFQTLKSLISLQLFKYEKETASHLLAAALGDAFRCENEHSAVNKLDSVSKIIHEKVSSGLKLRYLAYTSLITLAVLWGLIFFATDKLDAIYLHASIAGLLGAAISLFNRVTNIEIDPFSSKVGLVTESASRLVIGCVFGAFTVLVAYSNLALGAFKDNTEALLCFSFVSGFLERFGPDLIQQISNRANKAR